jgi:hypothetical protein
MRRVLVLLSCICGHLSSVSMFVTELVLWNLLQVYLAALRWTISSLLMLDLVWGSQTQLLYSNFGRIKDVYAFSFTDFQFTFRLRLVQGRIHKLKNCVNSRPKSVFKEQEAVKCLSSLHDKYVIVPAEKASNNIVFVLLRMPNQGIRHT